MRCIRCADTKKVGGYGGMPMTCPACDPSQAERIKKDAEASAVAIAQAKGIAVEVNTIETVEVKQKRTRKKKVNE